MPLRQNSHKALRACVIMKSPSPLCLTKATTRLFFHPRIRSTLSLGSSKLQQTIPPSSLTSLVVVEAKDPLVHHLQAVYTPTAPIPHRASKARPTAAALPPSPHASNGQPAMDNKYQQHAHHLQSVRGLACQTPTSL